MLPWKPSLSLRARRLAAELDAAPQNELAHAVDAEILRRSDRLASGIERYRRHPYRRAVPAVPCAWKSGTTRLLDYGPAGGQPLLVVPSLINRADILDLDERWSLLRALSAAGLRPFLLDWDSPGEAERGLDLTGYIEQRLEPAIEQVRALAGLPPIMLGYCMGGLLAVAAARRRQAQLAGLVLLATPWNFAAMSDHAGLLGALAGPLAQLCAPLGELPTEIIHQLFAIADPMQAIVKYQAFATADPASVAAERFVAVEDWLNDSVPLALAVAAECLGRWYGANTPMTGDWRVGGEAVRLTDLRLPVLVVQPARDRLVPPASVEPLAQAIPGADRLAPALGHIGIIVSDQAPRAVWQPVIDWIGAR